MPVEFREPCDWWFHCGSTTDDFGNRIPKSPFYCANTKSKNYKEFKCPRQTCPDWTMNRNETCYFGKKMTVMGYPKILCKNMNAETWNNWCIGKDNCSQWREG